MKHNLVCHVGDIVISKGRKYEVVQVLEKGVEAKGETGNRKAYISGCRIWITAR